MVKTVAVPRKTGRFRTLRGSVTDRVWNRFLLDDQDSATAWRVIKFQIFPTNPTGANSCAGQLTTSSSVDISGVLWNFADARVLACSATRDDGLYKVMPSFQVIDPDNLIVEDLWIYSDADGDQTHSNYLIILEQYYTSAWQQVFQRIRNMGQRTPSDT